MSGLVKWVSRGAGFFHRGRCGIFAEEADAECLNAKRAKNPKAWWGGRLEFPDWFRGFPVLFRINSDEVSGVMNRNFDALKL